MWTPELLRYLYHGVIFLEKLDGHCSIVIYWKCKDVNWKTVPGVQLITDIAFEGYMKVVDFPTVTLLESRLETVAGYTIGPLILWVRYTWILCHNRIYISKEYKTAGICVLIGLFSKTVLRTDTSEICIGIICCYCVLYILLCTLCDNIFL